MDLPAPLWWALAAIPAFAIMEPWSRLVHDKLWHGPLWSVHRTHHEPRTGRFEANDLFVLAHAVAVAPVFGLAAVLPPSILRELVFGAAIGVSLFGVSYALLHDGLVHGRLPVGLLRRWRWLRRLEGAHRAHHAIGAAPFGFFLGPSELRAARRRAGRDRAAR